MNVPAPQPALTGNLKAAAGIVPRCLPHRTRGAGPT
jgi:hypothetical protein